MLLRKILAYRHLLFLLILLNGESLFLTDDKKAGIPFLRELFLLGIIAATALLFAGWKRVYQSKTSLWILFMGALLPVSSAVLANLNFGQPIAYGLLEERRFFAYLIFFPTLYLLIKASPTQAQLEKYFLIAGVFAATVGFLYYLKIIPENAGVSFERNAIELGENNLRPDRYRIGASYITLCALMLMYSMKNRVSLWKLVLLTYFAAYLWLVLQTRQTMLIWTIAGIWIFRDRIDSLFKVASLAVVLFVASYYAFPEFYALQWEKFNALLFEATSSPGVRDRTIAIILDAIAANNYFGMGALSLQWNDGFARVYNTHFFLSDVGIFGAYYRYGFLTPFIALVFYVGYWRILRKCPYKGPLLAAFQIQFAFLVFNMVLSNALFFGGDMLGLSAALFLYYTKLAEADRKSTANLDRVSYDTLQYRHN